MAKFIPKIKKIVGGLLALGIFLVLALFGNNDFSVYFEKLKTDIFGAMPIITSIYPNSGEIGDLIYIEGKDLGETVEENTLKFDEIEAVVSTVGFDAGGDFRIIATVPDLPAGEYQIRLETPIGTAFQAEDPNIFTILDKTVNEIIIDNENKENKNNNLIIGNELDFEKTESEVDKILAEIQNKLGAKNEIETENADFRIFAENSPLGVQLSWEYPAAQNFTIFYGSQSKQYLHLLSNKSSPTFLSNLASKQQYFFRVVALDAAGNEIAQSNETATITGAMIATIDETAPDEPLHSASFTTPPTKLSEEGPNETLLISLLATFGVSGILFRRKITARK